VTSNVNKALHQNLPTALLNSLEGVRGFNRKAFEEVHENGEQVVSVRLNPEKKFNSDCLSVEQARSVFNVQSSVPWCPYGTYLNDRPSFTLDPLLHGGAYYVQEASGMFLWEALEQTVRKNTPGLKILDLCAAPGGKSTLLASFFKDGLIVSNEVIKSRAAILVENITKWGSDNVIATNNDPKDFASLQGYFDAIVIDAPCSGSGLFRKDPNAINEWSEESVLLCSERQQRILSDVYPSLKKNGIVIYSTCSYSEEEDEDIVDWMMKQFALDSLQLAVPVEWGIVEVETKMRKAYCYRFFPDKVKGEGFFIAVFRKNEGGNFFFHSKPISNASNQEINLSNEFVKREKDLFFLKKNENLIAIRSQWKEDVAILQKSAYLRKAGVTIGVLKGNDLIPDHELALSLLLNDHVQHIILNYNDAIQYLKKKELFIENISKGWIAVKYCGIKLGWIKVLHNRINNYYPTKWRILKD
jgi:16S rRNA C967 or C1407 C5-methylase (RsmB/RsmF family)/NOL1/NOP2/fmu family ribosome biogenesis protein